MRWTCPEKLSQNTFDKVAGLQQKLCPTEHQGMAASETKAQPFNAWCVLKG